MVEIGGFIVITTTGNILKDLKAKGLAVNDPGRDNKSRGSWLASATLVNLMDNFCRENFYP